MRFDFTIADFVARPAAPIPLLPENGGAGKGGTGEAAWRVFSDREFNNRMGHLLRWRNNRWRFLEGDCLTCACS